MFLVACPFKFPAVGVFRIDKLETVVAVDLVYRFLAQSRGGTLGFPAHALEMSFRVTKTAGGMDGLAHLDVGF